MPAATDNNVTISVIIPVSREPAALAECLAGLSACRDSAAIEVILVGADGGDDLPPGLRVRFVREDEPSPSVRRNRGAREARGEIFCFIDDDVRVPPDWACTIAAALAERPDALVGGPNRDQRTDFKFRLPSAIQSNPLLEGLVSHAGQAAAERRVGIHDLPLCNVAMTRRTFDAVGGFNERISYYFDDVEFNYIAARMGRPLISLSALEVQHDVRPALWPYLRYKLKSRWEIGRHFALYGRLYLDSNAVRLVLCSYVLLPAAVLIGGWKAAAALAGAYALAVLLSTWPHRRDPAVLVCLPACIPVVHLLMYLGFTAGAMWSLIAYPWLRRLVPQREERFDRFRHGSGRGGDTNAAGRKGD